MGADSSVLQLLEEGAGGWQGRLQGKLPEVQVCLLVLDDIRSLYVSDWLEKISFSLSLSIYTYKI